MNETAIGWILAMNGIIIVLIEMVLVYKLEHRGRAVHYMMLGAFLIGLAFLMLRMAPDKAIVITSMIVITFGEMLLFPFMNHFWVKRSDDSNRGQYAGIYTMSFSAAIVLAPTFASQIATWMGFNALWLINCLVCCLAALGYLQLKKQIS